MPLKNNPILAFSIDFEGFVEGMEQSFHIPDHFENLLTPFPNHENYGTST